MEVYSPEGDSEYGSKTPEIVLADDVILAPEFASHLESFIKRTRNTKDQDRASQLLASLRQQKEQTRHPFSSSRPKTAMPGLDHSRLQKILNPYTTHYAKEYEEKDSRSTQALRPKTSRAFCAPHQSQAPMENTTYSKEFYDKPTKRDTPIRSGTSSGNRRNNPHPPESFMVWKFAHRNMPEQDYSQWATPLTDDLMDQIMRGKCRSTYQADYLGLPQGLQIKDSFNAPEDWKAKVPFTLDSCARYSYQQPNQPPALKGNTRRYGCNKNKLRPAIGAVPTASSRQMNLKTRTTYIKEFCDGGQPNHLNNVARVLGVQAMDNYLKAAERDDVLEKLIDYGRSTNRSSTRSSIRSRQLPAATNLYSPLPTNWGLSTWTGPV